MPASMPHMPQSPATNRSLNQIWHALCPCAPLAQWLPTLCLLVLAVWGLTDVRKRGEIDPANLAAHRTDFTVYTAAAEAFFDGRDPYAVASVRGWHYLYPPLFALCVRPLAWLAPQWQCVAWFFLSLAMLVGCIYESKQIYVTLSRRFHASTMRIGHGVGEARWIIVAGLLAVGLPILNCLQRGQVGILVLYTLLLAARLILCSRSLSGALLGGIVLALPVAIKLTPALPAGVLVLLLIGWAWNSRRREDAWRAVSVSVGGLCGGVLFLVLVPGLMIGQRENLAQLHTWLTRVVTNRDVGADDDFNARALRNQSLANAIYRCGNWIAYELDAGPADTLIDELGNAAPAMPLDRPVVARVLTVLRVVLLASLLVVGWFAVRGQDVLACAAVFGLACTLTLLVSPLSWGHHYVLAWPAALLVPWWLTEQNATRAAHALSVAAAVLMCGHYLLLDWFGRIGWLGIGTTIWFAAAAVTLTLELRRRQRSAAEQGGWPAELTLWTAAA